MPHEDYILLNVAFINLTEGIIRFTFTIGVKKQIIMKQKIEIIDQKPFGYIIKNLKTNIIQLIPESEFKRRIKWGIYEVSQRISQTNA